MENLNRCGSNTAQTTGPALKTCESLLYELPYATSGFYLIQPNKHNGPYRVYCEVTESGSLLFVIEKNTLITITIQSFKSISLVFEHVLF